MSLTTRVLDWLVRRWRPAVATAVKAPRAFGRGPCRHCGEIVPLRRDGLPARRYHQCPPVPICPRCRSITPCGCGYVPERVV